MLQAFVYNEVAVLVRHWFEIDLADSHLEHGARVELRLLDPQVHRGSESAAQRVVVDRPFWRADLFDRLDSRPGGFDAAHFHPHFDGAAPSGRHWDGDINADPWGWLRGRLCDVTGIAGSGGATLRDADVEAQRIRADAAEIVAAARRVAPAECRSKEQCYAWTSDVLPPVRRMLDTLQRPDLLDRDRASPWLVNA